MLIPVAKFLDKPILGLHTGSEIAKTNTPIVDPRTLKLIAFHVKRFTSNGPCVLHTDDIREISNAGLIVDSADKLMTTDGLVRLQEVIDLNFSMDGLRVEDDSHNKLGSVRDYAVDPDSYLIQQLYVQPPFIKSIGTAILTIHRSQIISITNHKIIVKSPTIKTESKPLAETIKSSLVNPFRAPAPPQAENRNS